MSDIERSVALADKIPVGLADNPNPQLLLESFDKDVVDVHLRTQAYPMANTGGQCKSNRNAYYITHSCLQLRMGSLTI